MVKEEIWKAALAGLLHDIGKFAQRAGEQVSSEWREPETKAAFGYQHALHTYQFIDKYLPAAIRKEIKVMASYHHRPQKGGLLVQVADHLAAGERRQPESDDGDPKSHPPQLHPLFISLHVDQQDHPHIGQNRFYFPLEPLALEEAVIFPTETPLSAEQTLGRYQTLWDAFCAEANQVTVPSPPVRALRHIELSLMHH